MSREAIRGLLKLKNTTGLCKRTFYQQLSVKDVPSSKIKIRNRRHLPGSSNQSLPEFIKTSDHESFKIIKVDTTDRHLTDQLGDFVGQAIKEHPAILIKGFKINNASDLSAITKHFPFKTMDYKAGVSIRQELAEGVFTASDETNKHTIELHNEQSYIEHSPTNILFSCLRQSEIGGETAISFNRDIQSDLDPAIREKIRRKKIRYFRNLGDGDNKDFLSWQEIFGTNSKDEAEKMMIDMRTKWEWNEIGGLSTYHNFDSEQPHPRFDESVWFNQCTACHWTYYEDHVWFVDKNYYNPRQYPTHTCYGDGEEFEPEVLDHIREAYWKNAIPLKLEKGDILLLDNYLCCHSRMSFEGERRMITQLFV